MLGMPPRPTPRARGKVPFETRTEVLGTERLTVSLGLMSDPNRKTLRAAGQSKRVFVLKPDRKTAKMVEMNPWGECGLMATLGRPAEVKPLALGQEVT
jgi:hypothetical protein